MHPEITDARHIYRETTDARHIYRETTDARHIYRETTDARHIYRETTDARHIYPDPTASTYHPVISPGSLNPPNIGQDQIRKFINTVKVFGKTRCRFLTI